MLRHRDSLLVIEGEVPALIDEDKSNGSGDEAAGGEVEKELNAVELERRKKQAYRDTVSGWIASGEHAVVADTMIMLNTLTPQVTFMSSELLRSGKRWDFDTFMQHAKS